MDQNMRPNYTGRGPKGWKRSDERIHEDVSEMLARHSFIDASEMEVSVQDGVVTLQGMVEDRPMKRRAEDEVERITGVKDVRNLLSVRHSWLERMVDAAGGRETRGDGMLGTVPRNSNWRRVF